MGKKVHHRKEKIEQNIINPTLKRIKPITLTQSDVFKSFLQRENLCLFGPAGTGRTYISIYLSLQKIFEQDSPFQKLIIIRSVVPTREVGFLPGSLEDKSYVYEMPYMEISNDICNHTYTQLKEMGKIDFQTTSHLRGLTFDRCIVLVDEIQNMTYHELSSVITRAGKDCYYIFCGDFKQSDLTKYEKQENGCFIFTEILKCMPSFKFIEFTVDDVVRGPLMKEFLKEEHEYFQRQNDSFRRSLHSET